MATLMIETSMISSTSAIETTSVASVRCRSLV
jgi:hypothetical protein